MSSLEVVTSAQTTHFATSLTLYSIDNGVSISNGEKNYQLRTDLSARVGRLNPNWNEPADDQVYDVSIAVHAPLLCI